MSTHARGSRWRGLKPRWGCDVTSCITQTASDYPLLTLDLVPVCRRVDGSRFGNLERLVLAFAFTVVLSCWLIVRFAVLCLLFKWLMTFSAVLLRAERWSFCEVLLLL